MAKYYTPIQVKSPANADTFNGPLQELDNQIDANASQLAEQLALIQAHAAALQQQLALIQTNAADIASQAELVQELAADSTIHDQQLESLDSRLDTAEADIQAQGTALSGLAGQVEQAKTDIDNLESDVAGLDNDLTDVATDVSLIKTDMTDAKERLTTAEGDIDAVETAADGLDTRVTALEQAPGYVLPTASASDLGGVKVGNGLSIDQNGVLSASGGGGYVALCTTAASTAEKTITIPGITAYYDGLTVNIVLTAGHTASGMKFNINGLGAKTVLYYPYNTSWIVVDAVYYNGQFRTNSQLAGNANSVTVKPASNVTNEDYIETSLSQGRHYFTVNNKKCLLEVISVSGFAIEQTLTYVPDTVADAPVIKKKYGLYTTGSGWSYTPWIQVYPAVQSV